MGNRLVTRAARPGALSPRLSTAQFVPGWCLAGVAKSRVASDTPCYSRRRPPSGSGSLRRFRGYLGVSDASDRHREEQQREEDRGDPLWGNREGGVLVQDSLLHVGWRRGTRRTW